MTGARELRRGLTPERIAHEPADRGNRERRRAQHARQRRAPDRTDEIDLGDRLALAQRDREHDWHALKAAGEVRQPAQRRRVRPMRVIDRQQQRPLGGKVGREPVEAVQPRVQRRAAALLARPEDRAGKPGRPGEQPLSLAPGRDHDRPVQQLPDNPEGKVTLELAADGSQPAQARLARRFARGLEQLALADPRRPLDHQHAPGARARRVDQRGDLRQFGIALEHGSPGQTYAPARLLARAADATADSFGRPGQTLVATPDAQRAPRRDARGVTRPLHRTRLTLEIESTGGQIKGYLEDAAGRRQPFAGWLELAAALEAALPELAPYERGSPNAGPARTGARPTTVDSNKLGGGLS
jgi:hypothetical protein